MQSTHNHPTGKRPKAHNCHMNYKHRHAEQQKSCTSGIRHVRQPKECTLTHQREQKCNQASEPPSPQLASAGCAKRKHFNEYLVFWVPHLFLFCLFAFPMCFFVSFLFLLCFFFNISVFLLCFFFTLFCYFCSSYVFFFCLYNSWFFVFKFEEMINF